MSAQPASAEALAALFELRGASAITMDLLQPAEPYLDTAGEALRRRIYLTRGEAGVEGLKCGAHLDQVHFLIHRGHGDRCATPRNDLDQPFGGQFAKRLAHGHP